MIEFDKTPEVADWLGQGSVNFFGLPFAGKDSQANRLAERFGGPVLSSGEILRNSVISPEIKAMMTAGHLVPTDDFVRIVLPYLSKAEFRETPLFLSSVGRWHGEEDGVVGALEYAKHPLRAVVYLPLDEELLWERFQREENREARGARADDDETALQKRITEFNEKTLPVVNYYRERGYVIEVDASLPKDEVERRILAALALRASVTEPTA